MRLDVIEAGGKTPVTALRALAKDLAAMCGAREELSRLAARAISDVPTND